MKYLFITALLGLSFLFQPLYSKDITQQLSRYYELTTTYPAALGKKGEWKKGEIEILCTPEQIQEAQHAKYKDLVAEGFTPAQASDFSRVGVFFEDTYYIGVRDAVMFPSGKPGTYDRLIPKTGLTGAGSVVVLPILPTKQIVTIVNFRHATRTWSIELPRGHREISEAPDSAAIRELSEETGYLMEKLHRLGEIIPASGILASKSPIYLVEASAKIEPRHDYSEAISAIKLFSKEELKQALSKGVMEIEVQGIKRDVIVADAHISHALILAEEKGFI